MQCHFNHDVINIMWHVEWQPYRWPPSQWIFLIGGGGGNGDGCGNGDDDGDGDDGAQREWPRVRVATKDQE